MVWALKLYKDTFFYETGTIIIIKNSIFVQDKTKISVNIMDCECYVLLGWLIFDALVFIWAWMDDLYYSKDLKSKFSKIKKSLTEE